MYQQPFNSRDENRRISAYSLALLFVFVGAVAVTVYLALMIKPWDSDTAGDGNSLAAETPAAAAPTEVPAAAPAAAP